MKYLKCSLALLAVMLAGCSEKQTESPAAATTPSNPPAASAKTADAGEVAVIKTSDGDMVIKFWDDAAPATIANFKKLAKAGFYDGTCFHRIIKGFMVQGGDPKTKDLSKKAEWGTGGPDYTIADEKNSHKHERGTLAMANTGAPNSGGSQFYICLAPQPSLDANNYTTFGQLMKGDDVLEKIGNTPVSPNPATGEPSVPNERVEVVSIKIVPASSVQ
jgi:peptidyl-prolyl cis-trans isomerase B (cyclophilin B)